MSAKTALICPHCNGRDSSRVDCANCGELLVPEVAPIPSGRYRMTVEIEVENDDWLIPHDTGAMHQASWWAQRGATFTPLDGAE